MSIPIAQQTIAQTTRIGEGLTDSSTINTLFSNNTLNIETRDTTGHGLGTLNLVTSTGNGIHVIDAAGDVVIDGTLTVMGGGGNTPGGPNEAIQFNNAGSFGGSANFTIDTPSNTINVGTLASITTGTTSKILGTFYQPALANGNFDILQIGVSGASYNGAQITFQYTSSGSSSNAIALGLSARNPGLTINGSNQVTTTNNTLDNGFGAAQFTNQVSNQSTIVDRGPSFNLSGGQVAGNQLLIQDNVDASYQLSIGVDHTLGQGFIDAYQIGVDGIPLMLNTIGTGPVETKNATLDNGHGASLFVSTSGGPGVTVVAANNSNQQLSFSTATAGSVGSIQSTLAGTGFATLQLNPGGGAVTTALNTLDTGDGSGNAIFNGALNFNSATIYSTPPSSSPHYLKVGSDGVVGSAALATDATIIALQNRINTLESALALVHQHLGITPTATKKSDADEFEHVSVPEQKALDKKGWFS